MNKLLKRINPRILLSVRSRRPSKLRSKLDSMDILQEVMKDALPHLKELEITSEGGLIRWFSTLIANQIADQTDYYQTHKRSIAKEISLDEALLNGEEEGTVMEPRSPDLTPSGELIVSERVRFMESLIDRLSLEYQEVIRQRNIEGLEFGEIGRLMNRSADAARKLYHRAIDRLTTEMTATEMA